MSFVLDLNQVYGTKQRSKNKNRLLSTTYAGLEWLSSVQSRRQLYAGRKGVKKDLRKG